MLLYVFQAIEDGHTSITIRTGDTDVLVIMIGHLKELLRSFPSLRLYIMFKTSSSTEYYNVIKIGCDIGIDYCKGFMLFYAYTGCDYTQSFSYHGKSTLYEIFKSDINVKAMLQSICTNHDKPDINKIKAMVNFTLKRL